MLIYHVIKYIINLTSTTASFITMSILEYQSRMWPKRVPNEKLMHEIRQIAFYVHDDQPGVPSHLIAIYSTNIYQRPTPNPSEWRRLPAIYTKHISRLISRNAIFIYIHDHLTAGGRHRDETQEKIIRHLRSYIAYNDRVLDRIWSEARRAVMDDRMTSEWRSEALDKWLVLDVIVSDHSVDALRTFHKHNESSMLDVNPMEFGMSSSFGSFLKCNKYYNHYPKDWDDFYNNTPSWYNGDVTSFLTLSREERTQHMHDVMGWLSASLEIKDTDTVGGVTCIGNGMCILSRIPVSYH